MSDPDPASSPAPPTSPGPLGAAGPTNVKAIASIACGFGGLLLPGVSIAAVVLGIVALRAIGRSRPRQQGVGLAVVGICAGTVGIVANTIVIALGLSAYDTYKQMRAAMAAPRLQLVQAQAMSWAESHEGYPDHVARMIVDDGVAGLEGLVVEGLNISGPGLVTVGDFDLLDFDGSVESLAALEAALDGLDRAEPYYQFGQCWFVRLDRPRHRSDLVAGWCVGFLGDVEVVYDDGSLGQVADAPRWEVIWEADAESREELSLPVLPKPAFPGS
jgi:hypothetical protein